MPFLARRERPAWKPHCNNTMDFMVVLNDEQRICALLSCPIPTYLGRTNEIETL